MEMKNKKKKLKKNIIRKKIKSEKLYGGMERRNERGIYPGRR